MRSLHVLTFRDGQQVQLILKAFLELTLLRKGPEDIPKSSWLLVFAIGLAVAVNVLFYSTIETDYETNHALEFAAELIKVVSYLAILLAFRMLRRAMQTLTAIIACNAILGFLMTLVLILSEAYIDKVLQGALAWLVTAWLIVVEGHIISRAVPVHWITGIAFALVIFILQLVFFVYLGEIPEGAAS